MATTLYGGLNFCTQQHIITFLNLSENAYQIKKDQLIV